MRLHLLSKNVPVWTLAACLAVAAPGISRVEAASHRANAELLASQLPTGETLASASTKDVQRAVSAAVAKRSADAPDIVRIAMMAKMNKRRTVACDTVRDIVDAAIGAAPARARAIAEMAEALAPDCTQAIDGVLRSSANGGTANRSAAAVPGSTSSEGVGGDGGDFGAGLGVGFPGSANFGGSSPSGGFALPTPAATPVTSTTNG